MFQNSPFQQHYKGRTRGSGVPRIKRPKRGVKASSPSGVRGGDGVERGERPWWASFEVAGSLMMRRTFAYFRQIKNVREGTEPGRSSVAGLCARDRTFP